MCGNVASMQVGMESWALPALAVVAGKGLPGELLVPAAGVDVAIGPVHVGLWHSLLLLRVRLEVGKVVGSVAPLQLRSLMQKVSPQRFSQLGGQHVAARCAWGQGHGLLADTVGCSGHDGSGLCR